MKLGKTYFSGSITFDEGNNVIGPSSATFETITVSNTLNVTGNIAGAATTASYVEFTDIANKPTLISSSNQLAGETVDGDLTVTGKITAQEFHTEYVSGSIIYTSGSTKFGDSADDTHEITGSLNLLGSMTYGGTGLTLLGQSSDGADNQAFFIGAGGAGSDSRGAYIWARGNEATNGGKIQINAGNVSTGNIELYTGGTVRMFVSSSGNIGFGTSNPGTNLLSIRGLGAVDSNGNQGLVLSSNHYYNAGDKYLGNGYASIISQDTGGTYAGYIRFQQAGLNSSGAGAAMTLSDSMVIANNGNVGIGVSPSYKLDVDGEARVGSSLRFTTGTSIPAAAISYYSNGYIYLKGGGGGAAVLDDSGASGLYVNDDLSANINVNNSAAIKILSNGNVGIGTTNPTLPLDIADINSFGFPATSGTTPVGFMRIGYTDRTWAGNEILVGIINGSPDYAGYIQCKVPTDYSSNRALLLNPQGGGVGIGLGTTTAPSTALHVGGHIRSQGISTDNATKTYAWRISNTGNSGTVWRRIARFTGSQSNRIKIVMTGEPGYSNGASYGAMVTILAQFNNANNLQGRFSREGANQPIYGVNFEQISGTDYYINVQVGSYSEFAIEATISSGTLTTYNTSSTAGISANVAEEKRIHSPTYFLNGVGISNTSPFAKLTVDLDADSTGNVADWTSSHVVFNRGGTSRSQGIGFSVDLANGSSTISSLTPSVAWKNLHFRANDYAFYVGGATLGISLNSAGHFFLPNINGSSGYSDLAWNSTNGQVIYRTSSLRYKENIQNLPSTLDKIKNLRPVTYTEKETQRDYFGLIAEELYEQIPELVNLREVEGYDEPQPDSITYSMLSVHLVKAIQEQQAIIEDLKARIQALEG